MSVNDTENYIIISLLPLCFLRKRQKPIAVTAARKTLRQALGSSETAVADSSYEMKKNNFATWSSHNYAVIIW